MTLFIGHRNEPPMGEMGIAGTVTNYCVTRRMNGVSMLS